MITFNNPNYSRYIIYIGFYIIYHKEDDYEVGVYLLLAPTYRILRSPSFRFTNGPKSEKEVYAHICNLMIFAIQVDF